MYKVHRINDMVKNHGNNLFKVLRIKSNVCRYLESVFNAFPETSFSNVATEKSVDLYCQLFIRLEVCFNCDHGLRQQFITFHGVLSTCDTLINV
jgi:hypothetical protein